MFIRIDFFIIFYAACFLKIGKIASKIVDSATLRAIVPESLLWRR